MTQAVAEATLPVSGKTSIERGTHYFSPSRGHYLAFEADNNLVVRTAAGDLCWELAPTLAGRGTVDHVLLQDDGNLVVQKADNGWIWSTLDRDPEVGSKLTLTDSGVLQLVNAKGVVRWSSDGRAWTGRRVVADVTIYGSRLASTAALDAVRNVYAEIVGRLTQTHPTSRMGGYVVYLTNGDTWADLKTMGPITTEFGDKTDAGTGSGDFVRGGTSLDFLWIEEEMICKKGVKTRNDGVEAKKWTETDDHLRTFDQVVHEFGHAIEHRYGLHDRLQQLWALDPNQNCVFAWAAQGWFGCPGGYLDGLTEPQRALLVEFFGSEVFSAKHEFENPTGKVVDKPAG